MTKNLLVAKLIDTFIPKHYDLSINLDNKQRIFQGTVTINGQSSGDSISLHTKELNINSVQIDGKSADFAHQDHDVLELSQDWLNAGEHIVVIGFSGNITDAMHGLYPCNFKIDDQTKNLLATQFESHHAREVFPCVDEPAAKATFDVTLTTEKDITVLGNMPVDWQREENDQLVTAFQTTPKMSTYLLAWVVGELQSKSAKTNSGVEVNVYATKAQPADSLDFALDHAVESIEFFENYFGVDYPLPKSDQVALPDFSSGAMENWGLVTYRETALLADPKTTTIAGKQRIAEVISHELSHQWFGNLVTMKWWNNLWLNESFATLMAYVSVDTIHPDWDMWLEFASYESVISLRRDAIDGVQAVQVDVDHPDEISSLFDPSIVYAKGARLMRMLQDFIGHEAFQKGLNSYFEEFKFSNTEADDLWRHLSMASGQDISTMMNTWISQSGYPVVHVSQNGLEQEQFFIGPHSTSQKLWPIPLGAESTEDMLSLLEKRKINFPVSAFERLNIKDSSHFITHYKPDHLQNILTEIDKIDEIGRMQLLHEQTLLARGGIISSDQLIDLLQAFAEEESAHVWDMMALALSELKKFVETNEIAEMKLRKLAGKLADCEFKRLGWNQQPNESENDTKLRSTILSFMLYSEDTNAIMQAQSIFKVGIENIDSELRSLVISSVIRHSNGSRALIASLFDKYQATQSAHLREDIAVGLTSVRDSSQIDMILKNLTNSQLIRPQDIYSWFAHMIRSRYARQQTWRWMTDNWQWIIDNFAGDKSYDNFPRYAASGVATDDLFESFKQFFEPKQSIPALTRAIELGITEIEGRLDLMKRDQPNVVRKLTELAI